MRWTSLVFGWPSIIGGIGLAGAGLLWKRPLLMVLGTVVSSGFLLYLLMTRLWPVAVLVIATQLGAVLALRRGRHLVAWLLFAPMWLLPTVLVWLLLATRRY